MININNPEVIKNMKRCVQLRKKKRNYRKRKLKEWQDQKKEAKFNFERQNRQIDLWLEKMKDEISRAKRVSIISPLMGSRNC